MIRPAVQARSGRLEDVGRSDVRFALTHPVHRVAIADASDRWSLAFGGVGLEVADLADWDSADPPDLVVAPASAARRAAASGAGAVVLEGRASRSALEAAGYRVRRLLALPSADAPEVLVPVDDAPVLRYVLQNWTVPKRRWKVARNRLLGRMLPTGASAPGLPVLTVGERESGAPFLATAAVRHGVAAGGRWFLGLSQGDALSRGVLHLFPSAGAEPSWVLKFARVAGYDYPVERDRRGLDLALHAGGRVAQHAPRFLGRLEVEGLHVTVETAAIGQRLPSLLGSTASSSAKLGAVAAVADWAIDILCETATPAVLGPERARLAAEVLPRWGVDGAVAERVAGVPAVLAHNDLGTWNIVAGRSHFVVLDWESAVERGFPLWDLAYFLADASYQLDLGSLGPGRVEHFVRLFRGELAGSPLLFDRIRRAARALALPAETVGPLVTFGWLHHGLSHVGRDMRLELHAPGMGASSDEFGRMARLWLDDPALGLGWSCWR